jgi:hypothetical protein
MTENQDRRVDQMSKMLKMLEKQNPRPEFSIQLDSGTELTVEPETAFSAIEAPFEQLCSLDGGKHGNYTIAIGSIVFIRVKW